MITIRLARHDEIAALNTLIAMSARQLSKEDYLEEEIEGAITYIFGVDTQLLVDQTYFVIQVNQEIAGCGGWSKRNTLFGGNQFSGRANDSFLNPLKDPAKLRALFINPKFSRQGLGRQLFQHCEQQAWLHGFTQCEMMATLPGVKLYNTLGYKEVTQEIITMPNGQSLKFIRMHKYLNY